MKVFVTGGTGSVGLAVAEAFQAQGHTPFLFATKPVPARFGQKAPLGDVAFLQGDIRSACDLEWALGSCRPHIVIHLAAVTPDSDAEKAAPERITEVNITGVATLMKIVRTIPEVRRTVMASSVAVYGHVGPEEGTISEHRPPAPGTLYGISKVAAEKTALRLADLYRMDVRIARIGAVYGPWEHGTAMRPMLSPHAQLLERLLDGKPVVLDRPMAGDWLYSRDAGRGIVALAQAPVLSHEIYNIGNGHVSTVADWGAAMADALHESSITYAVPGNAPTVLSPLRYDRAPLSIDRLLHDTDYVPCFTGADTIVDYLNWMEQYPDDL